MFFFIKKKNTRSGIVVGVKIVRPTTVDRTRALGARLLSKKVAEGIRYGEG